MKSNSEIWKIVEDLRSAHATLKVEQIPLDLISFVELDLRLDLIPYDGLKNDFGADAAIFPDFTSMGRFLIGST